MITNDEAFIILLLIAPWLFYLAVRTRKLIALYNFKIETHEAYEDASMALLKKHCEQLKMAQMHNVKLEPIKARMRKEDYELARKWRRVL